RKRFPKSWTSSEEIHQQKSKDGKSPVSKTLKTAKDAFPQAKSKQSTCRRQTSSKSISKTAGLHSDRQVPNLRSNSMFLWTPITSMKRQKSSMIWCLGFNSFNLPGLCPYNCVIKKK